jgi:hypothetical protein
MIKMHMCIFIGAPHKGNMMRWGDDVAWAIAAIPFIGMSAIPVVLNLAVTGWDLSRVSWAAWALSAWLFTASVVGIRGAIADRDRPAHEQGREDDTRMSSLSKTT